MTDLSQFYFVEHYTHDNGNWPNFNYKEHNFILTSKHIDNSGAIARCKNCNAEAHVYKNTRLGIIFDVNDSKNHSQPTLSCKEIMIKNLLE